MRLNPNLHLFFGFGGKVLSKNNNNNNNNLTTTTTNDHDDGRTVNDGILSGVYWIQTSGNGT